MTEHLHAWQSDRTQEHAFHTFEQFPYRIKLLKWLGQQSWIPKGQDFLLRKIFDAARGEHFLFEIDFFGLRYRGDLAHYLDWLVFCYGGAPVSELDLMRHLVGFLRASDRERKINFYDVGANVGHHTLFMSPLVERVYAFEPFEDLIHLIEEKIALNDLRNVTILPFALGADNSEMAYYPGLGANPGVGSLIKGFPGAAAESIRVNVRNGDQLLDDAGLPRIDILKLDVQGFEPNVLSGLSTRMESDRPIVLTEISDESREGFGGEVGFRKLFYKDALFVEITGRNGRTYAIKPFDYATAEETLVIPLENSAFLNGKI